MATDELTETLQHILTDAVERGVFSGAQAGLLVDNGRARLWSVGHTAWPDAVPDGHTRVAITNHTRFDLASLTKAVVTAPLGRRDKKMCASRCCFCDSARMRPVRE